jgi:hypothetical protein
VVDIMTKMRVMSRKNTLRMVQVAQPYPPLYNLGRGQGSEETLSWWVEPTRRERGEGTKINEEKYEEMEDVPSEARQMYESNILLSS